MLDNYFVFNGKKSSDFGLFLTDGTGTFGTPERAFEEITVTGMDGTLLVDQKRYENVEFSYKNCLMYQNTVENLAKVRNWLASPNGYVRLSDTFHPDEFYLARLNGKMSPDLFRDLSMAKITLTFTRKPQRFLVSGDSFVEYASGSTISNPYPVTAKPIIRCYGSGAVQIGEYSFEIKGNPYEYLDVDSELQDCYHLTDNGNNCLICEEFPLLEGDSALTWSGFDKIEIKTRLWQL